MKLDTNTILIIVATLVVAAGAYWYFFTGTGNEPPLSVAAPESATQVRFKLLVSELKPISFITTIFSDARFASLVDLKTPITPESSGRLDPFAVIPGVSGE